MIAGAAAPAWPISVVTVDSATSTLRGTLAEFRRHGIALRPHLTGTAALLDLGREPGSVMLVPSDLTDMHLDEFVALAVGLAHAPVLVGLLPGTDADLVRSCLDRGAHGIVDLPVSPERLATAIGSLARTGSPAPRRVLRCGPLTLDVARYRVEFDGEELVLAPREFELLGYLMEAHPRVTGVAEIVEQATPAGSGNVMSVRVAIRRIRRKFAQRFPGRPPVIETVRGVGYRIGV